MRAAAEATAARCDHIDLLVSRAGISGGDDPEKTRAIYNVNVAGAVRMVEAFLPLMQAGMRRLASVLSEAGSVSVAHRRRIRSATHSKTALIMLVRCMFRTLYPMGYCSACTTRAGARTSLCTGVLQNPIDKSDKNTIISPHYHLPSS